VDLVLNLDAGSAVPPYEQLRSAVAGQVADGTLVAGTRLPTVRALAADLGLAANTVAKAYRALETDGVIETRGRAGTFVASTALAGVAEQVEQLAADYALVARRAGLTAPEALSLVQRAWEAR
jgi:DNA-binding transcriptional regulator YhcF (GntR family)